LTLVGLLLIHYEQSTSNVTVEARTTFSWLLTRQRRSFAFFMLVPHHSWSSGCKTPASRGRHFGSFIHVFEQVMQASSSYKTTSMTSLNKKNRTPQTQTRSTMHECIACVAFMNTTSILCTPKSLCDDPFLESTIECHCK